MLISFSVKNFRSFRERVTLDMRAVESDNTLPKNVLRPTFKGKEFPLLKSAVLYGANASGKTNFLLALRTYSNFIVQSQAREDLFPVELPFWLSTKTSEEPTEFELEFLLDGVRYRYGFVTRRDIILKEWLYAAPLRQERFIFDRTAQEDGSYTFRFGEKGRHLEELTKKDRVRSPVLLLTVGNYFNVNICEKIFSFIKGFGDIDVPLKISHGDTFTQAATTFLQFFDTGLQGLLFLYDTSNSSAISKKYQFDTFFVYTSAEGKAIPLHEGTQSAGTLRLLKFFTNLYYGYKAGVRLFRCDEIDSSLHPHASEVFLQLFHAILPNVQLICTTHNAQLLNEDIFRSDQVWIAEKDQGGNSSLYSIADFKGVRKDAHLGKQYLGGRFGGLPILDPRLRQAIIEQFAALVTEKSKA